MPTGAEMPALPLGLVLCVAAIGGESGNSSVGDKSPTTPISAAQPVLAKIERYAQRVVHQYDRNRDGRLQAAEYQAMAGQPARADADHDGVITPDEFARYVAGYAETHKLQLAPLAGQPTALASLFVPAAASGSAETESGPTSKPDTLATTAKSPPSAAPSASGEESREPPSARRETKFYISPKRLPSGLPDWFLRRDEDGDGQLTLAEFAPRPTPAQLAEFARLDLNRDGVVTAREYLRAMGKPPAGKAAGKPQKRNR